VTDKLELCTKLKIALLSQWRKNSLDLLLAKEKITLTFGRENNTYIWVKYVAL